MNTSSIKVCRHDNEEIKQKKYNFPVSISPPVPQILHTLGKKTTKSHHQSTPSTLPPLPPNHLVRLSSSIKMLNTSNLEILTIVFAKRARAGRVDAVAEQVGARVPEVRLAPVRRQPLRRAAGRADGDFGAAVHVAHAGVG